MVSSTTIWMVFKIPIFSDSFIELDQTIKEIFSFLIARGTSSSVYIFSDFINERIYFGNFSKIIGCCLVNIINTSTVTFTFIGSILDTDTPRSITTGFTITKSYIFLIVCRRDIFCTHVEGLFNTTCFHVLVVLCMI